MSHRRILASSSRPSVRVRIAAVGIALALAGAATRSSPPSPATT